MKKLLVIGFTIISIFGSTQALAACKCTDCNVKDVNMQPKCTCKHKGCQNH